MAPDCRDSCWGTAWLGQSSLGEVRQKGRELGCVFSVLPGVRASRYEALEELQKQEELLAKAVAALSKFSILCSGILNTSVCK